LPLSNLTGNPEQDYYVDGLQDILITELSQIRELRVTSRQSTKRYRDSQLPATDIAQELGVDALVEGSLLWGGSRIEVSIQLIHGRSDEHIWAGRYERESSYVFDLVSDVANAIGAEIVSAPPPGPEMPGFEITGPVDPRAIEAYALGLMYMDRFTSDGIRFAIEQFQEAVYIEPSFALAWGNLAVAHAMYALHGFAPPRETIEKSRAAALQAIESDNKFYIGHSTLGWVRLWTGDHEGACESFREALRLNPSAPYALHGDADCLMLEGRMEESVSRTRELLLIGPFSAMHNRPLAFHLFIARRYDEAISAAQKAQVRVPGLSMNWLLAQIYWTQGQFDKAVEAERLGLEQRGDIVLLAAFEKGLPWRRRWLRVQASPMWTPLISPSSSRKLYRSTKRCSGSTRLWNTARSRPPISGSGRTLTCCMKIRVTGIFWSVCTVRVSRLRRVLEARREKYTGIVVATVVSTMFNRG
jgi:TolB-like protein